MSTQKMRALASKRVSGTRVLTLYTFFIFNYSSTREYSKRVLLEASRHYMMIY